MMLAAGSAVVAAGLVCQRRLSDLSLDDGICFPPELGYTTWTSKMAKIMDPILPTLCILGYWHIILGSFGGPGKSPSNTGLH